MYTYILLATSILSKIAYSINPTNCKLYLLLLLKEKKKPSLTSKEFENISIRQNLIETFLSNNDTETGREEGQPRFPRQNVANDEGRESSCLPSRPHVAMAVSTVGNASLKPWFGYPRALSEERKLLRRTKPGDFLSITCSYLRRHTLVKTAISPFLCATRSSFHRYRLLG